METFKELTIELNKSLRGNDRQALNMFIFSLQGNGFKIEYNDKMIKILLKKINYYELQNNAKKIDKEYDTKILSIILNKIDSLKSYGIEGNKRNYVDYNKERKVKNRKQKEEKRGQYFYAKGNFFSTKNNNLSGQYIDKIICGDSENILRRLPDNSVDLIFTSPPYNFGLDYDSGHDDKFWESYFDKLFRIFDECVRVLMYGGRVIINVQPLFSDYIPSHHIISNYFLQKKLIWKGEILWEKNNYNCKYTAWGSWKSPSSPYLKYTWEFLEIFCKGTLKKEGKRDKIDITAEEFKQWVVAKWPIAPVRNMKKWGHPAMFPEKLVERALKLFSYKDDVVLDPFNGVGTTTAVAKRLERKFLGIDISKEYCDIAKERLKNTVIEPKFF